MSARVTKIGVKKPGWRPKPLVHRPMIDPNYDEINKTKMFFLKVGRVLFRITFLIFYVVS